MAFGKQFTDETHITNLKKKQIFEGIQGHFHKPLFDKEVTVVLVFDFFK